LLDFRLGQSGLDLEDNCILSDWLFTSMDLERNIKEIIDPLFSREIAGLLSLWLLRREG